MKLRTEKQKSILVIRRISKQFVPGLVYAILDGEKKAWMIVKTIIVNWLCRTSCPYHLSEDLRRHLAYIYLECLFCSRCGCLVESSKRAIFCIVRSERLCFTCYHKARWPCS